MTDEIEALKARIEALEQYTENLENMNVQIMFFIQNVLDKTERIYH